MVTSIRPAKPTPPIDATAPPPDMRRCSLLELDDGQCRWPLGDVHQVATLFCGGAAVPGVLLRASSADGVRQLSAAIRSMLGGRVYMKLTADRPYARSRKSRPQLVEIANSVEVVQDGRIYIELINGPFLFRENGTPEEYQAGLDLAIERGWLELHESGTFVRFTHGGPSCLLEFTPAAVLSRSLAATVLSGFR